ncbi:MAG: 1-deoxy-D-xylulose-5-phosphate reductoisomerase [Vicinamibacteria bacterium]|jgi:1-deoxy-D-xylulose-5-phosphate reductoisomerase|nr:1-deoxy-D-xylulose-5-phosphate reductoisomerase [Vicinamibacteria bacterium]
MKGLSLLGSTGSIGTNVLRIVETFPDRFRVVGLAGGKNVERLAEQIARHKPQIVSVSSEQAKLALGRLIDLSGMQVGVGQEGMVAIATHAEAQMVVASAVGAVGLVPTYRAMEAGKDIALANKETLVMAGELMMALAKSHGVRILPIDSEHCALHQCLDGRAPLSVRRLVLTASGGPFRHRPRHTFAHITPEEALNHPTWSMGRKISIDSATLMNKGLEVIEARWLFGVSAEAIHVLIHPQSVIHSMVEFIDGTVLAQLGVTDMRLPIQYALSYPEHWPAAIPGLDFMKVSRLDFDAPDHTRFPCLGLAYEALRGGGTLPAVLNAANEEAVAAFLEKRLSFQGIAAAIAETMAAHTPQGVARLDDVLAADAWARQTLRDKIAGRTQTTHS